MYGSLTTCLAGVPLELTLNRNTRTGPFFDGTVPTINYGANGLPTEEILLPQTGAWIIERVEAKNYIFQSGQGSYRIYAGPGNDQLYGGPNNDRLSSRNGNDLLQGFGGNDDLYGWEDNDVLLGGDGNDRLYGDLALEQEGRHYLVAAGNWRREYEYPFFFAAEIYEGCTHRRCENPIPLVRRRR